MRCRPALLRNLPLFHQPQENILERAGVLAGLRAEIGHGAFGQESPLPDNSDALRQPFRNLEDVGGKDDRAAVAQELGEHVLHQPGGAGVETGERLVEAG